MNKRTNPWAVSLLVGALFASATTRINAAEASVPVATRLSPHETLWEATASVLTENGDELTDIRRYREVGTGINYFDETAGELRPSNPSIEIVNGKGVIRQTMHKAVFAGSTLDENGLAEIWSPDGERIVLQTVGLALTDPVTGNSAWIAEVQESVGELVAHDTIIYPNALVGDGVVADLKVTSRITGVECDVVLKTRISRELIEDYLLPPDRVRIEAWHAVLEKGDVEILPRAIVRESGIQDANHEIRFGQKRFGQGSAFMTDGNAAGPIEQRGEPVQVAKELINLSGLDFLIEAIPFIEAEDELSELPEPLAARRIDRLKVEEAFAKRRNGEVEPDGKKREKPVSFATKEVRKESREVALLDRRSRPLAAVTGPGYVIDYVTYNQQSLTNFTFKSDETLYVTGVLDLYGKTVLEGGSVVKFTNYTSLTPRINVHGPIECQTALYNPAIFTSKNDDSVGEIISGSSGAPSGFFAHYSLYFPLSNTNAIELHDLRTSFTHNGLGIRGTNVNTVWNFQAYNCDKGIEVLRANLTVANALLYKTRYAFSAGSGSGAIIGAEHVTARSAQQLFLYSAGETNWLNLTNSLVYAVTNDTHEGISSNYTAGAASDAGIFAQAGRGGNYLAEGSPHRNAGTANVTDRMQGILRETTTEPPLILTDNFEVDTVLYPNAARDTDTPDLGYHYDPLDYAWGYLSVRTNRTLVLTNGVAVAVHSSNGTMLNEGARFISEGSPFQMNRYVHPIMAQELPVAWNTVTSSYASLFNPWQATGVEAEIEAKFTEFAMPANSTAYRYFVSSSAGRNIRLTDCRLRNVHMLVRLTVNQEGHGNYLTNNYLHRPYMNSIQIHTTNKPGMLRMWNNLVYGGTAIFKHEGTNSIWAVHDNLFDGVALTQTLPSGNPIPNGHNGYISTTQLTGGTGNIVVSAGDYESGPLGSHYYPTSGTNLATLWQAGSRFADEAGLYHHTITPDQVKAGTDWVSIGYHYVAATDDFGVWQAADTDGDGIPDHVEDGNGNGIINGGETDPSTSNSGFDVVHGFEVFTPLKD